MKHFVFTVSITFDTDWYVPEQRQLVQMVLDGLKKRIPFTQDTHLLNVKVDAAILSEGV